MKYVGIYWTLFAPLMKKSIAKRFDRELAQQALHRGKAEYRRLLSSADDLGPGNPMAMNGLFLWAHTKLRLICSISFPAIGVNA